MPILLKRLFQKGVKQLFVCFSVQEIEKKSFPGLVLDWVTIKTLHANLLQIQRAFIKGVGYRVWDEHSSRIRESALTDNFKDDLTFDLDLRGRLKLW